MKLISFLMLGLILFTSFKERNEPEKKSFCDGMKRLQKVFSEGNIESIKGDPWLINKNVFTPAIDVDELTDEAIGTQLGTFYEATYKLTKNNQEIQTFMNELVKKLESCLGKKAKKSEINGYKVRIDGVLFSVMQFGSKKIILNVAKAEE